MLKDRLQLSTLGRIDAISGVYVHDGDLMDDGRRLAAADSISCRVMEGFVSVE